MSAFAHSKMLAPLQLLAFAALPGACGAETSSSADTGVTTKHDAGVEPIFPEDLSGWTEARPCGFTHEHELRYIRVLVDPAAKAPYRILDESLPYEVGATLVKLE